MINPKYNNNSSQQGLVLIEAMIAILIFSMGVLAIVGLQAAMVKNASDSKFRAEASNIAQQRIGVMWADPTNLSNYIETNTPIPNLLPNGERTVELQNVTISQYLVTVTWQLPGESMHNFSTTTVITGG